MLEAEFCVEEQSSPESGEYGSPELQPTAELDAGAAQPLAEPALAEPAPAEPALPEQTSAESASAEQTSAEQALPEQTLAEPALAEQTSAESASAAQTGVEVQADVSQPTTEGNESGFAALGLSADVLAAVYESGYTQPTPIQAQIIPHMVAGRDVLAQSQTGTGKTAAFALPILSRIDCSQRRPQVLVLTPTRELAIQVAAAFGVYGSQIDRLNVATIYGGQSYDPQLRQLKRGAHVVVGTPGRIIDHLRKGSLDISSIDCLVLDEADEMLNMGFLEDIETILQQTSEDRQIALFSATLPGPIKQIADGYLNEPAKISIKVKQATADSIRQRATIVPGRDKVRTLCAFIEVEQTDGVIVFTKTKASTLTLAESLNASGFTAVALNGDMSQAAREQAVDQFKSGRLDVLVATDVAARGLDVSRVSHVFNFDPPHDPEAYIHRIGRTGRAGRSGEAICILTAAQRGLLRGIEKATKHRIETVPPPRAAEINAVRRARFQEQILKTIDAADLSVFQELVSELEAQSGQPASMIAAAVAHLSQQGRDFVAVDPPTSPGRKSKERRDRGEFQEDSRFGKPRNSRRPVKGGPPEAGFQRYRVEVGRQDGVKPGNLVGAIANEAGIDGSFIGPIQIRDTYSLVDLPADIPNGIYQSLRRTWVVGKQLRLSRLGAKDDKPARGGKPFAKGPKFNKAKGKKKTRVTKQK